MFSANASTKFVFTKFAEIAPLSNARRNFWIHVEDNPENATGSKTDADVRWVLLHRTTTAKGEIPETHGWKQKLTRRKGPALPTRKGRGTSRRHYFNSNTIKRKMHTVWVRLNAVVFFGLTVLLGLSCLAAFSKIGHSYIHRPGKLCRVWNDILRHFGWFTLKWVDHHGNQPSSKRWGNEWPSRKSK